MIDASIKILQTINPHQYGVRELASEIKCRPESVIENLKQMEEEGLITIQFKSLNKRGRPKKIPTITELGVEYLRSYDEMQSKKLKARKNDFISVRRDLERKHRLTEKSKSTHDIFFELREALVAIRNST